MTNEVLFTRPQFSIPQAEKEEILTESLNRLVIWHQHNCPAYERTLRLSSPPPYRDLAEIPFLPVSLFKTHTLRSIPDEAVFKTMTSSGTSGQQVSHIYLDRNTAELQARALASIMKSVLGPQRVPMLIVDSPNTIRDRMNFSARGAGILGMLPFGRSHAYILNDNMELDSNRLSDFLEKHNGSRILVFGFTFMIWEYFLRAIRSLDLPVDLSEATLIHSGGWKKLESQSVGNKEFKKEVLESTGISRVHDFYGMVEQVGSVFVEGSDGYLYPPNFADVIIRDPLTWAPVENGTPGVIEVLSVLPHSYPGHALLTEDLGVVDGIGSASEGWCGKRLKVLGRLPKAELRGCSDTHAYDRPVSQ